MNCAIKRYIEKHRWVWVVARLLVGATYLFSSLSKAVEPYGTVLKVEEYLHAMGLGAMVDVSTIVAVTLIGFEMLLGAALVLGALPRVAARVAVVVGALFSLFTLWVAVAEPVAECGCFGDVVMLTNWQTFGKNVVLLALSLVALWGADNKTKGCGVRVIGAVGAMILAVAFCIWGLVMLPVVDRFPFGEGVNISEAIATDFATDDGATYVVCKSVATGEERRFSPDDSEWWNEELWEFVRTEAPDEGVSVRARDFRVVVDDLDLTLQLLSMPICRLLVVEDVERISEREKDKLYEIARRCISLGNRVVVVTASSLTKATKAFPTIEVCNMDAVTLRALLRAPCGVVTLREGTVIHKATIGAVQVE